MNRLSKMHVFSPVCSVLFIALLSHSIYAQQAEWQTAHSRAKEHLDLKEYKEALSTAALALRLAEGEFGEDSRQIAEILLTIGKSYNQQGRFIRAQNRLVRALKIMEKTSPPYSIDLTDYLVELADSYKNHGKLDEAAPHYWKALAIYEKAGYSHEDRLAGAALKLGDIYRIQGEFSNAEYQYVIALNYFERTLGRQEIGIVPYLMKLGEVYKLLGNYREAERTYDRTIHIIGQQPKPDDVNLNEIYTNLAEVYERQGKYAKAEVFYRKAVDITVNASGEDKAIFNEAEQNYVDFMDKIGKGSILRDKFPSIILGYTWGFQNSFISGFDDEHISSFSNGLALSGRAFKNIYMTYNFVRHVSKKESGDIPFDPARGLNGASGRFVQKVNNVGIKYMFSELIPIPSALTWLGSGVSFISSRSEIVSYKRNEQFDLEKLVDTEPFRADGFYIEVGQMFHDLITFGPNLPALGIAVNIKYDSAKTMSNDIGGLSLLLSANIVMR